MFSFVVVMPYHKHKNVPSKPDHEIQDIVDAIKAVKIEDVPTARAANSFRIDRSLLRRYISKIEDATLDVASATNDQLFAFVFQLSEKTGGKTVCSFYFIYFLSFFYSLLFFLFFIFTGVHKPTRKIVREIFDVCQCTLLWLEQK